MRESTIERSCSKWAKDNGWLGYKFSSPSQRGVPDRLYIKNGSVVFVEFKALGKKPSVYQQHTIRKMQSKGAIVHIIDNIEGFINAMS